MSQEERAKLREGVPYVKLYRVHARDKFVELLLCQVGFLIYLSFV